MKKIVNLGLLFFFIVFFFEYKIMILNLFLNLKICFFSNTPVFWDKCGCISSFIFKFFLYGFFLSFF